MNRRLVEQAGFKDHFSGHASDYAQFRPTYPPRLFDWLAGVAPGRERAWDAACGNGQATAELVRRFDFVAASDASVEQVRAATPCSGVAYLVARAEASGLRGHSLDLVTVAQAAHWFDMDAFSREARRVLRPGGVVAAWCYELTRVDPAIDAIIDRFYRETLDGYWPPERALIEAGYRDLAFPFDELETPEFHMSAHWTLPELLGYLGTWSAYRRFIADVGDDPLPDLARELSAKWGGGRREVRWPLHMRVGKVERG